MDAKRMSDSRIRFSFVSADLSDADEDMIAIPRWALAVLAGELEARDGCGSEEYLYEPGCSRCDAIRIAAWASECAGRKIKT